MTNIDTFSGPSFSLKNRLARVLWNLVYTLFIRFSPNPCHQWRNMILRLFGAKIGKSLHMYPKATIWAPWNLILEDECGIANGVTIYSQGTVHISKCTMISQGAHLVTGTHDYTKLGFPLFKKPITVGDYVWVAAETFIHPGVTIGTGSVIGARSLVTKSIGMHRASLRNNKTTNFRWVLSTIN